MKKKRIIPLVLFKNGYVVQARGFSSHKRLGFLGPTLTRLEEWGADEIIVVNISPADKAPEAPVGRTDLADEFDFDFTRAVRNHAGRTSVPLTIGGGIRGFYQAAQCFEIGADKVLINSGVHLDKGLVPKIAGEFGSQAVVLGVDYKLVNGIRQVFIQSGQESVGKSVSEVAQAASDLGAGEFFLSSIDRDGMKQGLDLDVIAQVAELRTPVIVCGGVGEAKHITDGLRLRSVDGVAAANYFQHVENSVQLSRNLAATEGILVRHLR